jgi:hypothetical protein
MSDVWFSSLLQEFPRWRERESAFEEGSVSLVVKILSPEGKVCAFGGCK